jgi:hypothetical protein
MGSKSRIAIVLAAITVCVALSAGGSSGEILLKGRSAAPKGKVTELVVTDFGVAARVRLPVPLERTSAAPGLNGAGIALALEHTDGSVAGIFVADLDGRRQVRVSGRTGKPAVVLAAKRDAWFFVPDPDIARVAISGFALKPKQGRAGASLVGATSMIAKVLGHFPQGNELDMPVEAWILATPPPRTPGQRCDRLKREIEMAEEVLRERPTNPYPSSGDITRKHGKWEAAVAGLKAWLPLARAHFAANCPPRTGTGTGGSEGGGGSTGTGGGPGSTNVPPKVEWTAPGGAWTTGQPLELEAKASDPDGQVTSWTWNWGDGTVDTGTGDKPKAKHTYTAPAIYQVTVTVTDDKGGTASHTEGIAVGGPGSKNSDKGSTPEEEEANKDFEFECPPVGFIDTVKLIVRIPSYAQSPDFKLEPDPMCVGAANIEVTGQRSNGNVAGTKDAWGNLDDTYTVTIKITGAGAGGETVHPVATVTWK